jgi:hypothetical protein
MPINGDLSTPNPVRAHIRALIRRLLNHPAGDLIQPADADLPDLQVRDRAGVPPSSLIWLSEAAGWARKSGLRRATLRVSLHHACRVMRRQPRSAPLAQGQLAEWSCRMNSAVPRFLRPA